jgi:hypothetical protein
MKKRHEGNIPVIILSVFGILVLTLCISFVYLSLNGSDYTQEYSQKIESKEIRNPINEFALEFLKPSDEIPSGAEVIKIETEEGEKYIIIQANLEGFDAKDIEKELVSYSAVILKIYNLHEIPFFGIRPKIQVVIDNRSYNIEVRKGNIIIREGTIAKPDITLRTTYEEIFKMIENNNYAFESLESGRTSIEFVANKFILFAKGYLTLYNEFNKRESTSFMDNSSAKKTEANESANQIRDYIYNSSNLTSDNNSQ